MQGADRCSLAVLPKKLFSINRVLLDPMYSGMHMKRMLLFRNNIRCASFFRTASRIMYSVGDATCLFPMDVQCALLECRGPNNVKYGFFEDNGFIRNVGCPSMQSRCFLMKVKNVDSAFME